MIMTPLEAFGLGVAIGAALMALAALIGGLCR